MLADQCIYHITRDNTVAWADQRCHPCFRNGVGKSIEDTFPGILKVMQPVYDEAWLMGCAYRVVFFHGVLAHVVAHNRGDHLEVGFQRVPIIGLREALAAADEWLSSGHELVA